MYACFGTGNVIQFFFLQLGDGGEPQGTVGCPRRQEVSRITFWDKYIAYISQNILERRNKA